MEGHGVDDLTRSLDIGELMAIERVLDQRVRSDGSNGHYGAVLVSVEGLKRINSEHGTTFGDEVLKALARHLHENYPDYPLARVDSDKFAFLVDGAEQSQLSIIANQIRFELNASPWAVDDRNITATIGVVALTGPVTFRLESHLVWAALRAHRTTKIQGLKRRLSDSENQLRLAQLQGEVGALRAELALSIYHRDVLTGLLNRLGFKGVLSSMEVPYALAFVDLDNLRDLNDTEELLWDAGDQALIAVARVLESISPEATAMRWAGDEFLVVLPGLAADTAKSLLESHLRSSKDSLRVDSIPITVSGGVVSVQEVEGYPSALKRAEKLAKQAKREGRARILAALPE
jgi:diguanylate cyclase (GGDEF)-like protein